LYESVEFSSIKILKKIENILSIINKVWLIIIFIEYFQND
jgi:hypothetical protein